ncbi:MAG: flagellar FliJ family protein [Verrucomicrobiota bacterium]
MKRFRYSLQAVFTLRQREEQQALELYARALAERQQAITQLEEVHQAQAEWWSRWNREVSQGCSAGSLQQWQRCNYRLTEQERQAVAALNKCELAVNKSLQSVLLARQAREAVEQHLHRQKLAYARDLNRAEQSALDDLAQRRLLMPLQFGKHLSAARL